MAAKGKSPGIKTVKNTAKKSVSTPKIKEKPQETPEITQDAPEITHDICSISALSRRFKLDRKTVRDRIEKAGIEAIEERAKEKLYLLDEKLESVLSLNEMDAAKLKKTEAEAELKEIEVKRKLGEFASVAEFTEIIQRLMSRFYSKTVVNMPRRIAMRLHNADSSAEVARILTEEMIKEWKNLRDDYPEYINDNSSRNRKGNR